MAEVLKTFPNGQWKLIKTEWNDDHHVLHAYIPEDKIHSYVSGRGRDIDDERDEGEILVKPHEINIHKTDKITPEDD